VDELTVGAVSRDIQRRTGVAVSPFVISNLFYRHKLDPERCRVIDRVRLIPAGYVAEIEAVLRRRGLLPAISKIVEGAERGCS
jgi:hypothetical protein